MSKPYETSQVDIPAELNDHDTRISDNDTSIADQTTRISTIETAPFCSARVLTYSDPSTAVGDIRVTEILINNGGFSLANNKLVIPRTGYYRVRYSQLSNVNGSGTIYVRAFNGANHHAYRNWNVSITNTHHELVSEAIGYFSAGGQIAPYINSISGSTNTWGGDHSMYTVQWLRP